MRIDHQSNPALNSYVFKGDGLIAAIWVIDLQMNGNILVVN